MYFWNQVCRILHGWLLSHNVMPLLIFGWVIG